MTQRIYRGVTKSSSVYQRFRTVIDGTVTGFVLAACVQAQGVPIPKTAAEVPGPAPGTAMTTPYVQAIGQMAYMWAWPLVNVANRSCLLQST